MGMFASEGHSQEASPEPELDIKTRPARILTAELAGFDALSEPRRKLIETAFAVAWDNPWLSYQYAGSSPEDGGFDCSGATYFVMRKAGHKPARSSRGQMAWLEEHGNLHTVAAEARDLDHPSFANLMPGDLLFWARATDDGGMRVHHVAMYLGTEKKDGHPVMIGSTDGRSYRGQVANGYGVHDFRIPRADSPSKLIAYGPPPGAEQE